MPQTYAENAARMQVLNTISIKYPDECWNLFLSLLPSRSMIGHTNAKLRWRDVVQEAIEPFTDQQYFQYASFFSNKLRLMAGNDPAKISALLKRFEDLDHVDRLALLEHIHTMKLSLVDPQKLVWEAIREILYNYHSDYHPLRQLSNLMVGKLKELYELLTPGDVTEANLWVFDSHWAKFPEGRKKRSAYGREAERYMEQRQIQALKAIYKSNDFDRFLSLVKIVKEPGTFGKAAALIGFHESRSGMARGESVGDTAAVG